MRIADAGGIRPRPSQTGATPTATRAEAATPTTDVGGRWHHVHCPSAPDRVRAMAGAGPPPGAATGSGAPATHPTSGGGGGGGPRPPPSTKRLAKWVGSGPPAGASVATLKTPPEGRGETVTNGYRIRDREAVVGWKRTKTETETETGTERMERMPGRDGSGHIRRR